MTTEFKTSSHEEFVDYYREQSDKQETWDHFERIYAGLIALHGDLLAGKILRFADIGGGSGTFSRVVASHGHKSVCIDLNEPLIEIGRKRAADENLNIEFHVASATDIPLDDKSMDVCIVAELLEHIEDWEVCLNEVSRITKPGGAILLSTTNAMCPVQSEFNLPMYSWYPAPLKESLIKSACMG